MDMKDIAVGMLLVDNRGKLCIVMEIDMHRPKNPILYKTGANSAAYIGPASFFRANVGTVDLTKLAAARAVDEALPVRDDLSPFGLPNVLKGLKVGDMIKMRHGRKTETVEFIGYNHRAPKHPVNIRMNGKEYRCPLGLVIRENNAPAKRTEKEIMADIAGVYGELSPENLTGDGEFSQSHVDAEARRLNAKLRTLFSELGREVGETEAYKFEFAERT